MKTKEQFINKLTAEQKQSLHEHFDTIYECPVLTDHEYKIAYLAWLWANGKVYDAGDHDFFIKEEETGMSMADFEITFEDGYEHGGINLQYLYDYYTMHLLIEKMGWQRT